MNPAQIKYYAQAQLKRVKTDPEDAKVIADFCRAQAPRLWQPSTQVISRLQQWMGFKQLLEQQKVQLQNQMNSLLDPELKQNGVRGKKMVVAVMRKLIHIVFVVLRNRKPFDGE